MSQICYTIVTTSLQNYPFSGPPKFLESIIGLICFLFFKIAPILALASP